MVDLREKETVTSIRQAAFALRPLQAEDSDTLLDIYRQPSPLLTPLVSSVRQARRWITFANQLGENDCARMLAVTEKQQLVAVAHAFDIDRKNQRVFIRFDHQWPLAEFVLRCWCQMMILYVRRQFSVLNINVLLPDFGQVIKAYRRHLLELGFKNDALMRDYFKLSPSRYVDAQLYCLVLRDDQSMTTAESLQHGGCL